MQATRAQLIDRLAGSLAAAGVRDVDVAVVLGSGLGAFADELDDPLEIPFDVVEGMPMSGVAGHSGRFVYGAVRDQRVLVQAGRAHLYEGYSAGAVTRSVRAFARLGCSSLILTNAAGCVVSDWKVPALMRLTDHLNLQARTPLEAAERGRGTPYDAEWGERIDEAARVNGIALERGVYAGMLGPSYESPAEIRWLARSGVQAVGMSTVMEALAGFAAGMRVAALSCLTNHAAGVSSQGLSHEEVVQAGQSKSGEFCELLKHVVACAP